jgi:uncharacterized membrane-anchored protein
LVGSWSATVIIGLGASKGYLYTEQWHDGFFATAPVDPVDLLRGYYQTLGYEISSVDTLAKIPGSELKRSLTNGQEVFVTWHYQLATKPKLPSQSRSP